MKAARSVAMRPAAGPKRVGPGLAGPWKFGAIPSTVAVILALAPARAPAQVRAGLELDSVMADVMDPNEVSLRDIVMLPPNDRPDPFRLSRVDRLLREPFRIEEVTGEVLSRTAPDTSRARLPLAPDSIWPLLDLPPAGNTWVTAHAKAPGAKVAGDSARAAYDSLRAHAAAKGSAQVSAKDPGFSPEAALAAIKKGLSEETAALSPAEQAFLYKEAPGLFLQEEEDTARSAVENELRRLEDDARTHRIMELAARLDRGALARAAEAAWELECWIIEAVRSGKEKAAVARLKKAAGKDVPVHLGGKGSDRYVVGQGIWIDPGGDDEYVFKGPGKPGSFTLIVDAGGDDMYVSKDSLAQSAGNMGISLIADLGGSDRYLGRNFAWGAALFGYSSLFDAAGHDSYAGRCASEGFGFFGIGIVQDESGNDVYTASLMSQGAGSTRGAGLLLDRSGDDRYLALPTFKDDLRYEDHYLQMVQGFASGFSPDYAGGIGLLRDSRGNDVYVADIFGQGCAYWYSLGLLIDEAGDDRYEAHQYAQGAGVHIAIGALIDFAGNDHHVSKGVSQGCGHDFGFGLLYDRAGDDTYLATDMSQGAGSANGLGILQDAAGDDAYTSLNPEMTLGHADMRRDRGSFGFFLDRGGGKDRYTRPRSEGSAWRVYNGKTKGNGYGLDK